MVKSVLLGSHMQPPIEHQEETFFKAVELSQREATNLRVEGIAVVSIVKKLGGQHYTCGEQPVASELGHRDVLLTLEKPIDVHERQHVALAAATEESVQSSGVTGDADLWELHGLETTDAFLPRSVGRTGHRDHAEQHVAQRSSELRASTPLDLRAGFGFDQKQRFVLR
eukprot:CAMPEP_0194482296 /NCGR_PEP_ID=MMETSP0253-20130528/4318_1 /TAXON_ID=2966 /ORGANISM="Noctiluca scintillans" /LENGTH=168 /DNA_ID=CAMNT_0039321833 /DNA_START=266 /DNA_END=772 /DNA_ORIENTATION=-